jgi:hypothetical protein
MLRDLALLALVLAADDLHEVTDLEALHQSTSGASEMIFMNFFARSSRATGPEDARADRLLVLVDEHGAVVVELDVAAVGALVLAEGADHDGARRVALLHLRAGQRLFDGDDDDVAEAGVLAARAAEHLDALHDGRRSCRRPRGGRDLDHGSTPPPGATTRRVTSQRFSREIGRCSWISTRSPTLYWLVSSCAL